MDDRDFVRSIAGHDIELEAYRARYESERNRRRRDTVTYQYISPGGTFSHYVDDPYIEPGFTRPPVADEVDALIIGAGHAGLLAASRLRQAGFSRIRLIDRAGDVGGTWYWNRYPGVQCDIESYIYMPLLEETGYIPTRKYAFGQEIFEHTQRIARQFDLYELSLFQTEVQGIKWSESDAQWIVTTDRGDSLRATFVVIANGSLSKPKLPAIPGIDTYRGHTFHSSRWDYDYTGGSQAGGLTKLGDKRVGVIGTGATAIQVVPQVAPDARELFVFQRTPSIVGVRNDGETDPAWAASLTPGWQYARMTNFTAVVSGVEHDVDLIDDGWTNIQKAITDTAIVRAERKLGRSLTPDEANIALEVADVLKADELRSRVELEVGNQANAELLRPWYYLYCKRPCFHDGYLAAFARPNVHLVDAANGIERITETAVVVNGREYEVDCLIFASGFEVSTSFEHQVGYDPVGRGGKRLSAHWHDGPRSLYGLQVHGFPNLFITGIVQNASVLNFTHLLDEQARHIAYITSQVRDRELVAVEPTLEAEEEWRAEVVSYVSEEALTRWERCTPGWYNSDGDLEAKFGLLARRYFGGPVKFFRMLEDWRSDGNLRGLRSWATTSGGQPARTS